jgi:uncharacterized protein YcfJ
MQVPNRSLRRGVVVAGALAAASFLPMSANAYGEYAPVISATPIYQRTTQPQQDCWDERVPTHEVMRSDSGNQMVVPSERIETHCRTVQTSTDSVQGYNVRYVYEGREYVTTLPFDPGRRLRVDDNGRPDLR